MLQKSRERKVEQIKRKGKITNSPRIAMTLIGTLSGY